MNLDVIVMCGAFINGYSMADQLTYIGRILFGGDRTLRGPDQMERNGNLHCVELDLSHGGGFQCGTVA